MKKILFVLTIILLLATVSAQINPISVAKSSSDNEVQPGETATFVLRIKNTQDKSDAFVLSTDPLATVPFSDVFDSVIAEPGQIDLSPEETKTAVVKARTLKTVKPNQHYNTFLKITSVSDNKISVKESLTVSVLEPEELVSIDVENLPERIVPGSDVSFEVKFINNADLILDNVEIFITSELFSDKYNEKLFGYQDLSKDLTFHVPSNTAPGRYALGIRAYRDKDLEGKEVIHLNVVSNQNVQEDITSEKSFLQRSWTFTKENKGNLLVEESISVTLSSFQKIFTRYDKRPSSDAGDYVEWNFELKPGEKYSVTVITDYRSIFYAVIIGLALVSFIIYWLSIAVTIRKSLLRVSDSSGSSVIKIMLHVKNKTNSQISNVVVSDTLPSLVIPSKEFGTLQPTRIQKGGSGTRFVWEIGNLEKGEERIVSYKIKSKLHVIGRLVLPPASVKFKRDHKNALVKSNKLTLLSGFKEKK